MRGSDFMKKLILFISMSLIVCTLIACTSNTNNENESVQEEETKEEASQENSTEVFNNIPNVYEIPNDSWDLSPTFEHFVKVEDAKELSYTIIGYEDTLGITGAIPIFAEKAHKIFWFYFGEETIYDKPVEVKAIKEGTEELVDLHSGTFYKGAEVSVDSVNMPSTLQFPSEGLWKILVYIDGEFYESILIEVA
jgi:hypothetical protein